MGKFIIKKDKHGEYRFNLLAGNGQVILSSDGYTTIAACENGIECVRKNCVHPDKFEKKEAKNGSPYFRLKAGNGQIIGNSELYSSNAAMCNGIDSVMKNAPDANIENYETGEIKVTSSKKLKKPNKKKVKKSSRPKLLIIGHARHGKDTVAEMLALNHGYTYKGSSQAAAEIFIYEALKEKYGYKTPEECFEDRIHHRREWYELICGYNKDDKTILASKILEENDIYVGMRDLGELNACKMNGLFDIVIGVYNNRVPEENRESFNINLWEQSDIIIANAGSLEDLEWKVDRVVKLLNL